MSKFKPIESYNDSGEYELLPFNFTHLRKDEYVVTNFVGESIVWPRTVISDLVNHRLSLDSAELGQARSIHLVRFPNEQAPIELLALKCRTRHRHLPSFTNLHIIVVSLRCDHSCPYCQVSRQSEDRHRFDMSEEVALKSLDLIFRSPSRQLKIEFQGGEPLLNFDLVKRIVLEAENRAVRESKSVEFVIATTLSMLTEQILQFCADHEVYLSTSLDGPIDLHNKNRPRPDNDSYERFVSGLALARDFLGRDRVHALMTTTQDSLGRAEEIIDEYVALQFDSIFLRPLSPYGFAVKTKRYDTYDAEQWLSFYKRGLDYILKLNRSGTPFREIYTATILQKMLTFDDPGYVDLMNPAGLGIGAVVYNYDGFVYASDESRMLAEMGDTRFKLGSILTNTYDEIFTSDALISALDESFTSSSPMCVDCAFEPFCGADPVFHHGMYGDLVGRKSESAFCQRNMAIFKHLFELLEDSVAAEILSSWVLEPC